MRWTAFIIFLFMIIVFIVKGLELLKLYNLTNRVKYNNLTSVTVKRNVNVLDVAKLRFNSFLRDFNKTYNNEEYMRRFENFKESLKDIARLNRLENNTVFGLTKFSDMSKQEFADRMLLKPFTECKNKTMYCTGSQTNYEPFINKTYGVNIPRSYDWRKKGVVKPVLNQKLCQGCWAFSIVGVLESMSAIQLNDHKSRSIQELLDCSPDTKGCNKGNVATAMDFICDKELQFVTEEEYPMTLSIDQNCKLSIYGYTGRKVKRFEHNCMMDEDLMVEKIYTHGPLVVAVDSSNWQNYLGGVIRKACTEWLPVVKLYNNWNNYKTKNVAKLRFNSYLRDFNKTYKHEEYMRRFKNFKESLKDIARLNRLENNIVFGLTKFSDMSKQEFADRMLPKPFTKPPCQNREKNCTDSQANYEPFINKKLPRSFDWRKEGVVKPVLNQKICQGCWAFSIVGVLESMSAIQLKDYKSRSIQELLDCSPDTDGCKKGNVATAMDFICDKELQFVTEEEYPMTLSIDKICKLPTTGYRGRRVKWFEHKCDMNEDLMVRYIAQHGPLVVAVDATNWMHYIGGVITRACTRGISNHVVQIVGYEGYGKPNAETPIPYYIVRNSFGVDFGDQGYVKVAMKHGDIADVCGIAEQVTVMDVL